MFAYIRHAARSSALAACLLAVAVGPSAAAGADVIVG